LAHNIIYSAIEYAEELGFKPCREFTQTTSFFLEEDTDDIPLIAIECGGKDGKPLYVNTGRETPARENQILSHLEKTVGKGNYNYILNVNEDFEDEEDYDEINHLTDEIMLLDEDEQKELFLKLMNEMEGDNLEEEDVKKTLILSHILSTKILSQEEIDEQTAILEKDSNYPVVEIYQLPNSLFSGLQDKDAETVTNLFFDTVEAITDKNKAKKTLEIFKKEIGNSPLTAYLELLYMEEKGKKECC
jgi:hypothetical protein